MEEQEVNAEKPLEERPQWPMQECLCPHEHRLFMDIPAWLSSPIFFDTTTPEPTPSDSRTNRLCSFLSTSWSRLRAFFSQKKVVNESSEEPRDLTVQYVPEQVRAAGDLQVEDVSANTRPVARRADDLLDQGEGERLYEVHSVDCKYSRPRLPSLASVVSEIS